MNYPTPDHFMGTKVFVNRARATRTERRTWKERLFTLPWRPWIATKEVPGVYLVEDGVVFQTPEGFTMNPNTYRAFKRELENRSVIRTEGVV